MSTTSPGGKGRIEHVSLLYFSQKLLSSSETTLGSSGWRDREKLEVWKLFSPGFYPWVTTICGQSWAQHLPVTVASCVCTCFHHSSATLTHVQTSAILRSSWNEMESWVFQFCSFYFQQLLLLLHNTEGLFWSVFSPWVWYFTLPVHWFGLWLWGTISISRVNKWAVMEIRVWFCSFHFWGHHEQTGLEIAIFSSFVAFLW